MKHQPAEKLPVSRQHEIRTERDRLQAILDSMDDGIYIVDRDYRIVFMNLALRSTMGEGEGQLCHEFFGQSRANCEHCQHGMSSFGPEQRREWYVPKTRKTYELSVSPIHQPDGGIARLHLLRDITARKELEAQLQQHSHQLEAQVAEQAERLMRRERLALLGEIAAGLAHEIRTPLGALMTGIKLLERAEPQLDDKKLVFDLLNREIARLESKVSEFLTYARPRLPHRRETGLSSLLEEIRELLFTDPQMRERVTFKASVSPADLSWLLDRDQIKEALLNLCHNAVQAFEETGTISVEVKSFYAGILEILVKDNGSGIALDALPHIFKPFYSRRTQGTGLGLAICKDIIEGHGGHITVTSIPSLNTTFRITLPGENSRRQSRQNRV